MIAAMRLCGGNAGSARGAASPLTEALRAAGAAGRHGGVLVRADSAYYDHIDSSRSGGTTHERPGHVSTDFP